MARPAGTAKVPAVAPPKPGAKTGLDMESQLIILQGASIEHLHRMFRMDKRTITARIVGQVAPCGTRGGHPIYNVAEVAPYLVKPQGDFEEAIKRMHHDDIPPLLHKNYWQGKQARLDYEVEVGLKVDIHEAAEVMALAFKAVRMALLLMPDALEREYVLTDEHRQVLKKLIDGTVSECRDALLEAFKLPEDDHDDGEDDGDVFETHAPEDREAEGTGEDFGGL